MVSQINALPRIFIHTGIGPESGQTLEEIFRQKEEQRLLTGGTFLWGFGNSFANWRFKDFLDELDGEDPIAVMTLIQSRPQKKDAESKTRLAWTGGEDIFGDPYVIPKGLTVFSHPERAQRKRPLHGAFVCESAEPLEPGKTGLKFRRSDYVTYPKRQSVWRSNTEIIVRRDDEPQRRSRELDVQLVIRLQYPYFVKLREYGQTLAN